MADSARPVSGEIMTEPAPAGSGQAGNGLGQDVVDADYEVLPPAASADPSPSSAVAPLHEDTPESAASPAGMAMLRPSAPAQPFSARGGPLFWAAGVAVALAAFWISGGHALIRHSALFAAAPDPIAALSITGVTSHVDSSGGKPVLFVDGEAGNDGHDAAVLPPLEIRVTGEDGRLTRYTLGTSGRELASGQRLAFSSRLDVPTSGVAAVAVGFAE